MTSVSSDLGCSYASVAQNVGMSQLLRLTPQGGGGGGGVKGEGEEGEDDWGEGGMFQCNDPRARFCKGVKKKILSCKLVHKFHSAVIAYISGNNSFSSCSFPALFLLAHQYFPQVIFYCVIMVLAVVWFANNN